MLNEKPVSKEPMQEAPKKMPQKRKGFSAYSKMLSKKAGAKC